MGELTPQGQMRGMEKPHRDPEADYRACEPDEQWPLAQARWRIEDGEEAEPDRYGGSKHVGVATPKPRLCPVRQGSDNGI